MTHCVGIIANPAAGKDVRRLISEATIVTTPEKVALLRRAFAGIDAMGIESVLFMDDGLGIVRRALASLPSDRPVRFRARALEQTMYHTWEDTVEAARQMADARVDALLTLGGDGTNRLASREIGDIPLLPISTGTNNAFPQWVEATAAGLALGAVAAGLVAAPATRRKRIEIVRGDALEAVALIDAAVLAQPTLGGQAVWRPQDLRRVYLTQGLPTSVGWSALLGSVAPIGPEEPCGAVVELDPASRTKVRATIAPGVVREAGLGGVRRLPLGSAQTLGPGPLVLALDGEPLYHLEEGASVQLRITDAGPRVIDVQQTLLAAARTGAFVRGPRPSPL